MIAFHPIPNTSQCDQPKWYRAPSLPLLLLPEAVPLIPPSIMQADQMAALRAAGGGGMPNAQQAQEQQKKAEEAEKMRGDLLERLATPEARERLATIKLVKPDKALATLGLPFAELFFVQPS